MEIKEAQNKIFKIAEKINSGKENELKPEISLMKLMEKAGNLSGEFYSQKTNNGFNEEKLKGAIVGIVLEAMLISKLLNIDISNEIEVKINELNNKYGLD